MMAKKIHHPAAQVTKREAPAPYGYRYHVSHCKRRSDDRVTYHKQLSSHGSIARVVARQHPVRPSQKHEGQSQGKKDDDEADINAECADQEDNANDAHP